MGLDAQGASSAGAAARVRAPLATHQSVDLAWREVAYTAGSRTGHQWRSHSRAWHAWRPLEARKHWITSPIAYVRKKNGARLTRSHDQPKWSLDEEKWWSRWRSRAAYLGADAQACTGRKARPKSDD